MRRERRLFRHGIQADWLANCRWFDFLAVTPGPSHHGNLAAVGPRHRRCTRERIFWHEKDNRRNSSRTISRRRKQAYSRSERFTAGAANLRRNSYQGSRLPRFLLGCFTCRISKHPRHHVPPCGFENSPRNESRRWILERVLVRTRGRQRILNLGTKTGARFCGRRSEMNCRAGAHRLPVFDSATEAAAVKFRA